MCIACYERTPSVWADSGCAPRAALAASTALRLLTCPPCIAADARSIFLEITLQKGPDLTVALPKSTNVLVPGWYMLVLLNLDGLPSTTKFIQSTP